MSEVQERRSSATDGAGGVAELDAIVIGGGLGGRYALHRLRGLGLTARGFEAGSGIGGTRVGNHYPGARCDVWTREYRSAFDDPLQPEFGGPFYFRNA
mgnify:CR=1 FL=1